MPKGTPTSPRVWVRWHYHISFSSVYTTSTSMVFLSLQLGMQLHLCAKHKLLLLSLHAMHV